MTLTSPTVPITRPDPAGPLSAGARAARVVGGLVAAAAAGGVVALLYVVAVLDRTGRRVDNRLMHAAMDAGSGVREEVRFLLELAAPAAMLGVAVLVLRAWWRGQRGLAVAVGLLVLGAQLITQALKAFLPGGYPGGNSLPSGHVTVAVTTVVALVLLLPRLTGRVLAVGVPAVLVTALATMVVGWHRPSDILAAVAVVAGVAGLTLAGAALTPQWRRPRSG